MPPELPSGTVTFLLTDLEGSTRLWEHHPEAMSAALARHDSLLAACIAKHRGMVVKSRGEGDSLFAVFSRASEAVASAIDVQLAMLAERWSPEAPLRARIAIHTGEAELREGDYFGAAVNRCARLRSIAHGEQIVLSGSTAELVAEALPPETSLRPLGAHRLRDLVRPEQVFQLVRPGLPVTFPPLRSLDALPNNLPSQLTSFIGREAEMAEVRRLLAGTRMLTIAGPGGAGKTRLSIQVGADLLDQYADGVWLVELAALTDPSLVPQAVASAIGVREEPGEPLISTLDEVLRPKRVLVLLDNCEHLIDACAHLAERLLRSAPGLRILATSRQPMGVPGETTWLMPSLALPRLSRVTPADELMSYEAVRLFVERASTARPDFAITPQNAPAILELCIRLEGAPLAIELAAARVKVLTVEQIVARLDNRFDFLTGGGRTRLPRQQTLKALVDWSYDLLSDQERAVWRRLSVFVAGFSLAAAEAVTVGDLVEDYEVLDLLTQLVDKSLVLVEDIDTESRYRCLETLREYGRIRLEAAGEVEPSRREHAQFYLSFAEQAESELRGPRQASWLERLEREHDNLRAALRWGSDRGQLEMLLRFGAALWRFWWVRGYLTEGQRWLDLALEARDETRPELRARVLDGAGTLAWVRGDYKRAVVTYEESLKLFRDLGDKRGIALSLSGLGNVASAREDYDAARDLYDEGLQLRREVNHLWGIASSLHHLAILARGQGDYANAEQLSDESMKLFRDLGHTLGVAQSLNNLGMVALEQHHYDRAASFGSMSLALLRQQGARADVPQSLEILGGVAGAQGRYERAARLFGASEAMRESTGAAQSPAERAAAERDISAARAGLGEQRFAAAWAEGRLMLLEAAIAYAADESDRPDAGSNGVS